MAETLTARQQRELDYHRTHARQNASRASEPVAFDVVESTSRRWWNAYWTTYDILKGLNLAGKRVLVPGCGFGEDAIRISRMGADVYAFDLSPESIEICRERVRKFNYNQVRFDVMSTENLEYKDNYFDLVFCMDILHHVNIVHTVSEFKRVIKNKGKIVGNELYTHGIIEKSVRKNRLVDGFLYPRMVKFIYRTDSPYITEDEHKIDDKEFSIVTDMMNESEIYYFNLMVGRVFPDNNLFISKLDRRFIRSLGDLGKYLAGRVVFNGTVA